MRLPGVLLCAFVVSFALFACSSGDSPDVDGGDDSGADGDTDSDTDSDTDADAGEDGGEIVCTGATYEGDYEVSSADDLSGIEGYAAITGTLEVSCLDCPDLSRLACMESVGGNLFLNDNLGLTSFAGLEALSGDVPGS